MTTSASRFTHHQTTASPEGHDRKANLQPRRAAAHHGLPRSAWDIFGLRLTRGNPAPNGSRERRVGRCIAEDVDAMKDRTKRLSERLADNYVDKTLKAYDVDETPER